MAPRKKDTTLTVTYSQVGFYMAIASVIGAGYTVFSGIVTKPEFSDGMKTMKNYVDERTEQAKSDAIAHSDANRQAMMLELKGYGADLKALSVKTDLVLESVREVKSNQYKAK